MNGLKIITGIQEVSPRSIPEIISRLKGPYYDVLADCTNPRTITCNGEEISVRYIPSGIAFPDCKAIISSGVTFDPDALQKEIRLLNKKGIKTFLHLWISLKARVRFPVLESIYVAAIMAQERGDLSKEYKISKSDLANILAKKGLTVFELSKFSAELLERMMKLDAKQNLGLKIEEQYDIILSKLESWNQNIFLPYARDTENEISKAINNGKNVIVESTVALSQDEKFVYFREEKQYANATTMGILSNIGINAGKYGFSTIGVIDSETIDLPWCKEAVHQNDIGTIVLYNTEPQDIICGYYSEDHRSLLVTDYSPEVEHLTPQIQTKRAWKKNLPKQAKGENDLVGFISQFVNMNSTNMDTIIKVCTIEELYEPSKYKSTYILTPYSV